MKQRTKRDLKIFLALVVVIGGGIFYNAQTQRGRLAAQMEDRRTTLEAGRMADGTPILRYNLIRSTRGSLRSGAEFDEHLLEYDGKITNIVGFMVPYGSFRDVSEFMLLPIPLECYFCARPPTRDVLWVNLRAGETAQIYEEPVMINGRFTLHHGTNQQYFYSMEDALVAPAEEGAKLNRRRLEIEHMAPQHERDPSLLLPGIPEAERVDTD